MRSRGWQRTLRTRLAVSVAAAVAALGLVAVPSAAFAADDETLAVDAPAGAVTAWVELEQAGLEAGAVRVTARVGGTAWQAVPLIETTFGLHGSVPVREGRVQIRVVPAEGTRASSPDAALTVLDADWQVLASTSARLSVPAGSIPGSSATAAPATVAETQGDSARTRSELPPWLAVTGTPGLAALLAAAVAVIAIGLGVAARSRRRRAQRGA